MPKNKNKYKLLIYRCLFFLFDNVPEFRKDIAGEIKNSIPSYS
ncbi:hypothetical protein [Aquimarina hainanensis]